MSKSLLVQRQDKSVSLLPPVHQYCELGVFENWLTSI